MDDNREMDELNEPSKGPEESEDQDQEQEGIGVPLVPSVDDMVVEVKGLKKYPFLAFAWLLERGGDGGCLGALIPPALVIADLVLAFVYRDRDSKSPRHPPGDVEK